jgi:hypothetical protein
MVILSTFMSRDHPAAIPECRREARRFKPAPSPGKVAFHARNQVAARNLRCARPGRRSIRRAEVGMTERTYTKRSG